MKLLYLWVENHKEMIKNQSFNISNSYHIDFDMQFNRLHISKNKEYIENFYGNNILDITAIVGRNGTGKTTITRSLYKICDSVNPVDDDEYYPAYITKHIVIYEVESQQEGEPSKLIIHYFLSKDPSVEITEDIVVDLINLKDVKGDEFERAEKQHNMTTVYFTNAFEVNNVLDNQGFSEFSSSGTHKSLAYTPMLSLHRAFINLRENYGSKQSEGGLIVSVIEQYAQNMTRDFKLSYATAQSYNYLIATRYFPGAIARILPVMKDFKISITEFGQYIKYKRGFIGLSKMDWHVMFIRNNIYEYIALNYKKYHWEQMYVNIICEIALFVSLTWDINFEKVEHRYSSLNKNKSFEILLEQIKDNEENTPKKELIRRIRNVQGIDLSIIKEFIEIVDRYEELNILATSTWYKQVQNFLEDYDKIKNIEIEQTINYGFNPLIELIIEQYNNKKTIYSRMINIIPQPMSSGEIALINIFATVYSAMKKRTSGSILLIIDEIDAFLHPKWQQDILTHITRWINESEFFYKKKVQLVVATHSPIILSDIPRDNIIYLKEPFEVYPSGQLTFGANISTLFYDSFFMEKGSIGAIARREIQWAIDNIENTNLNLDNRKRLVYIINNIGDKFLRENLKSYPIYIESAKESRDDL
ncbi:MAG TPA: hypothetical protein DDW58_03355 [Clostridiaceae bacterium]|jgi:AAA15 family ATPase/GTPase|nr:hypothetical protein [Clostridiaceae bacterium]HBG38275.1 hypothetical protein [Clostridiaceae bacterium]HBN28794.1 hypothetical protein [Clostridiaceae bacterium]